MQIILKQDVDNLGYKNDVVDVRDGYARNFLIPNGVAMVASTSNLKILKENVKQQSHKAEKMLAEAKSLAEKIQGATIEVSAKVGDSGKIFGSINTVVLAEALKKGGYNVERKTLQILDDGIKTIGTYKAVAQLHKEVKVEFNFNVVAE
jgi:large subunit ribosomal protein L9